MLNTLKNIVVYSLLLLTFVSCSVFKKTPNPDDDPRIKAFNFNFYFLEANKQKILGNYSEALQNYQMALGVDGTQAAVCYEIAGILNMARDYPGALEYAKKSVELDETDNEYYRILLAYVYQNNSMPEQAVKVYEDLLEENPADYHYYFEISDLLNGAGKSDDALKILNKAEKQFGITDMISLEKEKIYNQKKDYKNALAEIQKLTLAYPDNMRFKTILAESYVNAGDLEAAKKLYDELENTEQEDGIIYFSMADFYRLIGEYDKTFLLLQKGFARDDVDVEIKVQMTLSMLDNIGNDDYLITNVGKLLEILTITYPDNMLVRALSSDFLTFKGDYQAAQKEFDFILERDKNKFEIWEQALHVDFLLQDMPSMYKRGKEAVELYPNVLSLYRYYIVAAYFTENYLELTKAVDYASLLAVSDQELLIEFLGMQADAYHKIGEHQKSDSVFETILFKDSENISALNNYSYFLAIRGEYLDKALEMSSKLITIEKNNPAYIDTHAWVLYKKGDFTKALDFINQAILIDPENAVYFEHKGDILFKLGKQNDALEMWIKASEKGKGSENLNEKIETKKLIE
jgi:tetratricopeptide (TPR) repeat protein